MTINIGETIFSSAVGICRIAAAMALLGVTLLTAGGCASSNTGNTAPVALVDGPKDTGSYPNLNIPPQVAAKQLTPEETKAKLAQLKGDQQAQLGKSGGTGEIESASKTTSTVVRNSNSRSSPYATIGIITKTARSERANKPGRRRR